MSHDGPQEARQNGLDLSSTPAMPSVPRSEVYRGRPRLILDSGVRHSLGWQDDRKAGPSFVVTRSSSVRVKVAERFPLTETGWANAWQALVRCDPGAAEAVAAVLAKQEAVGRAAAAMTSLNSRSLCVLRSVTFSGGSGSVPLAKGQFCDLRFLNDSVMVSARHSAQALLEMPYQDVESVDVSGSGSNRSGSELLVVMLVLGLLGGLLGLLFLGLPGFFLGALIFGVIGAIAGSAWTKIETTVRLRGRDAELFFLDTRKRPDPLRIELSEALRAIVRAHATQTGEPQESADVASESIPDQLSRLASLLQQGLITREEFEHLKARLIAQP